MKTKIRMDFMLLMLLGCIITSVFCKEPELIITPVGNPLMLPAGEDAGIVCSGISEDDSDEQVFTEMQWTNPQGETIQEGVRLYGKNSFKLSFIKPTLASSGNYSCSALYRNARTFHASKIVEFFENIRFKDCFEEQSLILGREGKISCEPVGEPRPDISWEKDGVPINSDRYGISQDGIVIHEVKNEDGGIYRVEAFVPRTGRDGRREITVTVQTPPEIIDLNSELRVIEGEQYVVRCQASGFPMPKYSWYDPQSRDLSQVEGFEVNADDGTLTINNVDRSLGGKYTCQASNPAGEDQRVINIVVLVKPVIIKLENMTKKEGDTAIFECHARGEPAPVLTIRKEGAVNSVDQNQDGRFELESLTEGGDVILRFRINLVKRIDDGLYYCSAENDVARVERVGHLEVQFAPNMSLTPSTSVKTWAANPSNLSCIAEANPNATITWKTQNKIIESDDPLYTIFGRVSYSNLLVKVSETTSPDNIVGVYTCEAENTLGVASVDIRLDLATVPGPLSQVLFDKATSTTITFKLLGPSNTGGLPITSYVVKYWKESEPESSHSITEWQKDTPYILSNLKPRIHYKFSFAAKNNVGVGDWLQKTYVMPVERVPEAPIFKTEMETLSDFPDRFEISWIIPDDNGEKINYYEIRYFRVEREINGWKQLDQATIVKIENLEEPIFELTGLSPNSFYKVELRANNKLGNSRPGTVVFSTRAGESTDEQTSMIEGGPLSLPGIIAIIVVAVLIMLILLDITCYVRFHCGLLYLMRYHTCGQSASAEKVRDVGLEDGRECVKEVSTANNGKIKNEFKAPSPKAISPVQLPSDRNRSATRNGGDKMYKGFPYEDTPMLDATGNRDGRPADLIIDESFKNKSPKGSKSSIGKSSPV